MKSYGGVRGGKRNKWLDSVRVYVVYRGEGNAVFNATPNHFLLNKICLIKWLDKWFGSNLDHHHADCLIGSPAITQQIMSGFWWHFQDSSAMIQGKSD